MDKDQAAAFVAAINAVQPYVPPVFYRAIANSMAAQLIAPADRPGTCR